MESGEVETFGFETIRVNGILTERLVRGQGTNVLFLHDAGGLEYSMEFVNLLAQHYCVHALSLPGFGATELPDHFDQTDDIAYHCLDYIEAEGLTEVILIGCSFGGWVAAEIAVKASARLSAMILIDAVGVKTGPIDKLDVVDVFYLMPEEVRELAWYGGHEARQAPTLSGATRIARNRESHALFAWSPLLHNPKLMHRLSRVAIPALFLWGEADRLVPIDYGRAYAERIKGSRFELIAKAGHLPHIEQPQATLQAVTGFLNSINKA